MHRYQEAQRIIESQQEEKRDLIMKHAEEASSLRRKIQLLTEQIESGPAPAMSAAPSSAGFTDFNAEMEALNMGPHDWDNFIFVNDLHHDSTDDFNFDVEPAPVSHTPVPEKAIPPTTLISTPSKKVADAATEQPVASGLLFFLLLCGAFVASKPQSSQPPDLPHVPADVRAAAPAVLNNLLSDSAATNAPTNTRAAHASASEPDPSGLPHANTRSRSRLDHMHHRLTTPTKQQEIDSAFSLTTAQYASLTNADYSMFDQHRQEGGTPRPRRNLAESLARMQHDHVQNTKAEVYTRSLLFDQIPDDVVKQFRQLVGDCDDGEMHQHQMTNDDEMFAYKAEP